MPAVAYSRFAKEVEEIYSLLAPATLCKMRQVLREFGQLDGVRKTSDLRPVVIARWIKRWADERAPATLDSLLRSFRSACEIGVASGYLKSTPFGVKVRIPDFDPDAPVKVRHHPIRDIHAVLKLATEEAAGFDWKAGRLEALVNICAYAALRKNEALFLHREDVDFANHVLFVNPLRRKLKTKASAATIPMHPDLEALLRVWVRRARSEWVIPNVGRNRPWTGGPPGHKPLDQVKLLGKRAGVEGLTILSFRHSFATHARAWGLSDMMVQAILRHTTRRTQRHYLHPDIPDFLAAMGRVSYTPPAPRASYPAFPLSAGLRGTG